MVNSTYSLNFFSNSLSLDYSYINNFFLLENYFLKSLNYCGDCFFHGIDWIYVSLFSFFIFNIKINYINFFFSFFDQTFNHYFLLSWFNNIYNNQEQIYFSVILDLYFFLNIFKNQYFSEWFNFLLFSKNSFFLLIYHPELIFIKKNIFYNFFFFSTDFYLSIFNNINKEVFFSPIILIFQFIFIIFFFCIFILTFFNFYSNSLKEESQVDVDFLISSSLYESEKEITAIDDIILCLIVVIYLFCWYFYIHCWTIFNNLPELIFIFYLFPILYFIIIGIPAFLIYDFGLHFLIYLKGIGSGKIFLFELLFDYIAVIIFFTRIIVQGVRLILIFFTYISMNDLILYWFYNKNFILLNEWDFNSFFSSISIFNNISYFILIEVPMKLLYWIYEIFHTFFVVTVQFSAFFAIVFWLFLFLYTFFVLEKHENYFYFKRLKK